MSLQSDTDTRTGVAAFLRPGEEVVTALVASVRGALAGDVGRRLLRLRAGPRPGQRVAGVVRPRRVVATPDAPGSPLYSQGVVAGQLLLVSGTTGLDPRTGAPAGPTIQEQVRQALSGCEAVLRAGGAGLDDVVEVGVLLADPRDFDGMNEEYRRWFPADPPTRYVARLGAEIPGLLVSVRMTAVVG